MATKHNPGKKKRPGRMNYKAEQRWLINKVKKLVRHLKKYPSDALAATALKAAETRYQNR
jgi:ribosomal protein S15P/S13E